MENIGLRLKQEDFTGVTGMCQEKTKLQSLG
jgi:hypothetical protein